MSIRKSDLYIFLIAALFLAGRIVLFYVNLSTTLSPHSKGDIAYHNEIFYNLVNTGTFRSGISDVPPGGICNPLPYSSVWANHVNISPFIFTPVYYLCQNFQGLYAICIAWNYGILTIFTTLIIWRLEPDHHPSRVLVGLSTLFISTILDYATYRCHFILFSAPVLLPLFYAAHIRRPWLFTISALFIGLTSEDSALVLAAVCFAAAIAWPSRWRYFLPASTLASVWFMACVLIIQPWARQGIVTAHASHVQYILSLADPTNPMTGIGPHSYYPAVILVYLVAILLIARAPMRWIPVWLLVPFLLCCTINDDQIQVAHDIWFTGRDRSAEIRANREMINRALNDHAGDTIYIMGARTTDAFLSSRPGIHFWKFRHADKTMRIDASGRFAVLIEREED